MQGDALDAVDVLVQLATFHQHERGVRGQRQTKVAKPSQHLRSAAGMIWRCGRVLCTLRGGMMCFQVHHDHSTYGLAHAVCMLSPIAAALMKVTKEIRWSDFNRRETHVELMAVRRAVPPVSLHR